MKIINNLLSLFVLTGIASATAEESLQRVTTGNELHTNYGQRPTDALLGDERYEADRPRETIRMADPSFRPRSPASSYETQPSMRRETMQPSERIIPNQRTDMRSFSSDRSPAINSLRSEERAPRTFTTPQFERVEVFTPRNQRLAEDPDFSPLSTYTIPGDPQVRIEQPAPVYDPPAPVERIIYREPVYEVRPEPEVIIQREVKYVPVPDRFVELPRRNLDDRRIFDQVEYEPMPERYVELPRRNLDSRRIFDEPPMIMRAPVRRAEPRVFVPQYEPLPEPPRFSRERDRGVDTRIGTSLPAPTVYDRRAFDDLLPPPARYDFSRTPLEPEPVRYIRQRVATPEIRDFEFGQRGATPGFRDSAFDYRSTRASPTRFDSYRAPQSSLMFSENDLRRYDYTPNLNSDRRSRSWEDGRMREREMRAPTRVRNFRNTLPSLSNSGLPYY